MKKVVFLCCLFCLFFCFSCEQKTPSVQKAKNTDITETKTTEVVKPKITFEKFKAAYNKHASEILNETISEWNITDGEKADTAKFNGNGYSFLVTLSKDAEHHVAGMMYIFQLTQQDAAFMMNNFRMYALVLAIEPNTTVEEAAGFLSQLAEAGGKELTTRSSTRYTFQNVQGNIVLTVIL